MTTKIKGLISCFRFDHPGLHMARVTRATHVHTHMTPAVSQCTCVVYYKTTLVIRVHAMCTLHTYSIVYSVSVCFHSRAHTSINKSHVTYDISPSTEHGADCTALDCIMCCTVKRVCLLAERLHDSGGVGGDVSSRYSAC